MKKKKSDVLLFEKLYETYEQKIYYCAYGVLQNKEQAEDITQDIFEQLYEDKSIWLNYDDNHLTQYILRITKNKAIDLYRRNNTQIKYLNNYRETPDGNQVDNQIDDFLITEEILTELLSELKEPYRQVFMYRFFYELSFKETADILFTREDTVRKQYERARTILKTILGGTYYEETKQTR
ncbi:sigma-70 family RNA polymerase sigma factor [Vagococcus fluvialis]|uniref:sigma-70 family RNA polymerase sigma factor n=1 Tax=Vagococcus fluvialis TaxID=2738 RepID=UPI0037A2E107